MAESNMQTRRVNVIQQGVVCFISTSPVLWDGV